MEYSNLIDQSIILDRTDLSATEKLVAVALLSFRNSETGRCNPPIYSDDQNKKTICSRTGYTKQCIIITIASLEKKQIIICKRINAKPSEITFTVNDDYRKQGLPSTTITATVNDDYRKQGLPSTTITATVNDDYRHGKPRLPITDKEQIRTDNTIRENSPSDDFSLEYVSEDSTSQKIQSSNPLSCPYEELATLYNQVLGQDLGECRKLSPARKTALRSLWNECIKDKDFNDKDGGLAYFKRYFTFVRNTPFLVGKETAWKANFDWILKNNNYIKICEGFYNRPRNAQR